MESLGIGYSVHWNKVSRGGGDEKSCNAVAKAAYDHRMALEDTRTAKKFDYRHLSPCVASFTVLPKNAPASWRGNVSLIANAMELAESRSNSQTAWTLMFALPKGLSKEQQVHLSTNILKRVASNRGLPATGGIHDEVGNPHCHAAVATRKCTSTGFGEKDRTLMDKGFVYEVRKIVAEESAKMLLRVAKEATDSNQKKNLSVLANRWRHGNEKQGRRAVAAYANRDYEYAAYCVHHTPFIHMGPKAWALEKKNVKTRKGDINRQIHTENLARLMSATTISVSNSIDSVVPASTANHREKENLDRLGTISTITAQSISKQNTNTRVEIHQRNPDASAALTSDTAGFRSEPLGNSSHFTEHTHPHRVSEPPINRPYAPQSFDMFEDDVRSILPMLNTFDRPHYEWPVDSDPYLPPSNAIEAREGVLNCFWTIDQGLHYLVKLFPFADRCIAGFRQDYAPRIDGARDYDERARLLCEMFELIHKKISAANVADMQSKQLAIANTQVDKERKKAQKNSSAQRIFLSRTNI